MVSDRTIEINVNLPPTAVRVALVRLVIPVLLVVVKVAEAL